MSFSFQYPIKRVTNNPYASGNLLTHTQLNELGQNLYDLGDYVGNPSALVRSKNANQTLNSSFTNISGWTLSEITDPLGVFTLSSDTITVTAEGLYMISYSARLSFQNNGGTELDCLVYSRLRISNTKNRGQSGSDGVAPHSGGFYLGFVNCQVPLYLNANDTIQLQFQDVFNRGIIFEQTESFIAIARQG